MFNYSLKLLRESKGMTQDKLSSILKIKRSQYSDYEREYKIIPLKHLIKLADYYMVSIDYIFGFTKKLQYENSKNNYNSKLIKERLKKMRKENKLTQNELAKQLNTTGSVISGYEIERRLIATPFLYDICKKYQISADYILGRTDSPKYIK